MRRVPRRAVRFVAKWEGFSPRATDALDGIPTIGYGHTGPDVKLSDTITKRRARKLLRRDLRFAAATVDKYVTVKLNRRQRSALISFIFNCGPFAFANSTLLKRVNAKASPREIEEAFLMWNKANLGGGALVPVAGLTRRRRAEARLFNKRR